VKTLQLNRFGARTGRAVVLLHGVPAPAAHLFPLARALEGNWQVVVPDLPGYGASPRLVPYSLEGAREQLEDTLLAAGIREAAVVGFSIGAYRGLSLALARRIRVTGLHLLGGLAEYDAETRALYRQLVPAVRSGAVGLGPLMVQRCLPPAFAKAHPAAVEEIMGWPQHTTTEVVCDEGLAMAELPSLLPELGRIEVPLVARVGALDIATPVPASEAIVQRVRNAELEVVPGAGHALLLEDFAATLASVERLLKRAG
jgi:3-oxoadipate enol-lactonase